MAGWIGVDLDGTGRKVRIFTVRAHYPEQIRPIQEWCLKHIGTVLEITGSKDIEMLELWDDRAVGVRPNTGMPMRSYPIDAEDLLAQAELHANELVRALSAAGLVLTVEQRHIPPLAMGCYKTEVSVRRARGFY